MHSEQKTFCNKTKIKFPESFKNKKVLDVGSLDINGNNRYLFDDCNYIGIDLGPGENVDIVCPAHKFKGEFDTIISTEAFEHDIHFEESLQRITELLNPGGLFLFTCAAWGRYEHGTKETTPDDSPFTNEHYRNISEGEVRTAIDIDYIFKRYRFEVNFNPNDLYFWGIKRDNNYKEH